MTFAEGFLRDSEAFFLAMDAVSRGRYLRDDEPEASANSSGAAKAGAGARQQRSSSSRGGKAVAAHGGRKTGAGFPAGEGSLKGLARGRAAGGEPAVAALTGDEVWKQLPWLRDMEGFGLAAFLANR